MSWNNIQKSDAKILVVDDKEANVKLLEAMLKMAGYNNVRCTTDPKTVATSHKQEDYDIILLDIKMPHMDGYQVMEQLAQEIQDDYIPILVLTAQHDMETRLKALERGAKDFVTKPFDRAEVLNRIHNMLEVRELYKNRKQQADILEVKVQESTAELRERNLELEKTRFDIVRALGRAGEYRDNETGFHVLRMSKSCELIALHIGLGEQRANEILHAAPLHDIGKIGIPDDILLFPGKLDEKKWTIMKTHVDIGADIIGDIGEKRSDLMELARTIVLTHHEKWDGSGYPKGLKGEEIAIEGRICAIADVFDALTSARPYKKAWKVDDAVDFINKNAGSHFDPALVKAFNEVLPEILSVREKYADEDVGEEGSDS